MNNRFANLPPEADHIQGETRFEKGHNILWSGTYHVKGQIYRVERGEVQRRPKRQVSVDENKRKLLADLLSQPAVLPDRAIYSAMQRSGTDMSNIRQRLKNDPLPDGRLFTNDERMAFAENLDWFDVQQLETYAKTLQPEPA